jgi:ABC-2 type transport system permease protein
MVKKGVIFQAMYQAGRWPVSIYPIWLRPPLTFLVPVALAVTVPAQALTGRLDSQTLLGMLLLAMLFWLAARWFWHFGLILFFASIYVAICQPPAVVVGHDRQI